MFKKLDLLVIRTFIGPFFGTTFVAMIILILQFFWKYLDDMAGKGLQITIILKLIMYLSATVVSLSLPIGVLFASLFTFGNMGERYELVAIKSAGISFFRFMRPVFILSLIISALAFLFANNITPYSNGRFTSLLYDIVYKKPAFDLQAGIFYDKIEGYTIYIGSKEKDGITLNDVIIFENIEGSKYRNVVIAKKGILETVIDSSYKKFLIFKLEDGEVLKEDGDFQSSKNEFVKTEFKIFEKNMDLSSFKLNEDRGRNSKNSATMNISEIDSALESEKEYLPHSYRNNNLSTQNAFPIFYTILNKKNVQTKADKDIFEKIHTQKFQDTFREMLTYFAFAGIQSRIQTIEKEWDSSYANINNLRISWHKKFSLSVSCFIFFLIGSALGCITKKGGVSVPLIVATSFFIFYFFTSSSFEKAAKVGEMNLILGMWFSNIILLPIGIFLSYKALNDSQLFDYKYNFIVVKNFFNKLKKQKKHA